MAAVLFALLVSGGAARAQTPAPRDLRFIGDPLKMEIAVHQGGVAQ